MVRTWKRVLFGVLRISTRLPMPERVVSWFEGRYLAVAQRAYRRYVTAVAQREER